MADRYNGPPELIVTHSLDFDFQAFDFAVLFLAVMFFPVPRRGTFVTSLIERIRPESAFVIIDKVTIPPGYCGTRSGPAEGKAWTVREAARW